MARDFYLYRHGNGKFYAELLNPETGTRLATRSTGETERDKALVKVAGWLAVGVPSAKNQKEKPRRIEAVKSTNEIIDMIKNAPDMDEGGAQAIAAALRDKGLLSFNTVRPGRGREPFVQFLLDFWRYDKSPYIKEKLAHGHSFTKKHADEMTSRVNAFYAVYFKGRALGDVTRQDIKDFSLHLTQKREKPKGYKGQFAEKLAPAYINKILRAGTVALSWAYREQLIPADPTVGITKFSGAPKKRGVLTPQEAKAVFSNKWKDKRAFIGNLLAMVTGLRAGEVLALRRSDIGERVLNVNHSYSAIDGLKAPKTGLTRRVPLLPEVRGLLEMLINENPHKTDDPFVFYGLLPDRPMDTKILLKGLKNACRSAGIDAGARNITVHSWRHFYAARMSDKASAELVMRATGHHTRAVFDVYQNHIEKENLLKIEGITRKVMGNILPFSDMAAAGA